MIELFTKSLPRQLATDMQWQYEELVHILEAYANSESSEYYSHVKENLNISCFILGLALFYKDVVVPLKEGSLSFSQFGNNEIKHIQIGKYVFSSIDQRRIHRMYSDLNTILSNHNIPEQILLFSDVKDFARNLNRYFISRYA